MFKKHNNFGTFRILALAVVFGIVMNNSAPVQVSAMPQALGVTAILDTTFDSDGKVTTDFGGYEIGEGLALQPDGKIIVAGATDHRDYYDESHYDFALARYNSDGSLDSTFDMDGKVTLDLGGHEEISSIALQSDGKIVAAGWIEKDLAYSFVLLRYETNGSLDTTFDGDGKVITNIISGSRVATQSDGKIIVSGRSGDGVNYGFSLVRFNSNGSLDTTFDGDGKVITYFENNNASAGGIAIQPDGKIVVTGSSNNDFALVRYNIDGSLDSTFGIDGKLSTDFGGEEGVADVALQADGKIVVVGAQHDTESVFNEVGLAHYNSDGSLDHTFDTDGKVLLRVGLGDWGTDIVVQSDGNLLVAVNSAHASPGLNLDYDFALLRFNSDGSLDTTFDKDGKIILDFGPYDPADELALQPDGKIILEGGTWNSFTKNDDFMLARLSVVDPTMTISGNTWVGGATLSYTDGISKTVIAHQDGSYSLSVSENWSGTVTPSHPCYTFSPSSRSYSNVMTNLLGQDYFPALYAAPECGDTVGVFRPSNGLLYLKNSNFSGFADIALNYGLGGDYPVVGDWDGNGTVTIGVYRSGSFYLRNSNTLGFADSVFPFGQPGDQPVAGDWDGDGVDTVGVYRPSTGQFLLRNTNGDGAEDASFYLGNVGDVGIAGDWDGDGLDTTGVFRPGNGIIFLKNQNEDGFADIALNYGLPGDQPVTGDWDNDGIDTIGVYRNGQFMLRNSNTIGFAEIIFGLGNPGDMPIAGNWDGLP